jgi:DMSO reductase anchor subunit
MHPAWSIIFFTSISGLGLGLAGFIVLGLVDLTLFLHFSIAMSAVFGLIGAGLLSSTLHLGHPERAWRALSQWRSSWLSREGVLAILVLALLSCWFAFTFFIGPPPLWSGFLILVLITATVYATSMIYGSLKTISCWHHPLTPVCYLMFSACGGSLAFLSMLALFGQTIPGILTEITFAFLIGTWALKFAWWWALDHSVSVSTVETATGLGAMGKVRSLMPPHTSENYLQKEMGFVVARRHAIKLRYISIVFGGILPLTCVIFSGSSAGVLSMATIFHIMGVFVERWLFFAEAKHVVTLYYGDEQLSIAR